MKQPLRFGLALLLGLAALSGAGCQPAARQTRSATLIGRTEAALVDQIRCRHRPQVAQAINAMQANNLLRYVDNESGVYLFAPTQPMTFLGLPITHISGFDADAAFNGVPASTMVGTAPPTYLQVDVAAAPDELRKRALDAGLVEAVPAKSESGFSIEDKGSYLSPEKVTTTSGIVCWA